MDRILAGAQETLPCVPAWCSKCKKEVARLKVRRRTMKIIQGMDNGGSEEKMKKFFPGEKETSVATSSNYFSLKEWPERG